MYTISNRFQVCYQSKCGLESLFFETRSFFFRNKRIKKQTIQFQTPYINEIFFFRFAILEEQKISNEQ